MSLLHSGPFQRLFPNIRPFWDSCTTSPWSYVLRSCPMRRATFLLWVIVLLTVANSFCGPQFPWIRIFLKTYPLHHATDARDTFLHAAANSLRDPQSPQVISSGSLRRLAATCLPLYRFFIIPKNFTAASSVGTSRCSPSCMQQPTPSGIHNLLRSFPLALCVTLQLHVCPCAASSSFPKISLRPLP
jgi:hypothetical protein